MISEDAKNSVIDYNQKGALTRAFFSPSWGLGWIAGVAVRAFQGATEYDVVRPETNDEFKADAKRWATNYAEPLASGFVGIAKMMGATGALTTALSSVLSIYSIGAMAADAFGAATGESFGALKAGYYEGRIVGFGFGMPAQTTAPRGGEEPAPAPGL